MSLFNTLLALHIFCGSVALLSGPVPMLSRKGGRVHRRAGDVFAVAMIGVAATALILAAVVANVLLLVIAVFTFFLVYNGVRAIAMLRGGQPSVADDGVCVLTAVFSAWLLYRGVTSADPTRLFFGVGGCLLSVRQLRLHRDPAASWLVAHLSSMGGAYIATLTAFLVVNLTFLPQAVVFICPTLVGAPLIAMTAIRYRRMAAARPSPAPFGP